MESEAIVRHFCTHLSFLRQTSVKNTYISIIVSFEAELTAHNPDCVGSWEVGHLAELRLLKTSDKDQWVLLLSKPSRNHMHTKRKPPSVPTHLRYPICFHLQATGIRCVLSTPLQTLPPSVPGLSNLSLWGQSMSKIKDHHLQVWLPQNLFWPQHILTVSHKCPRQDFQASKLPKDANNQWDNLQQSPPHHQKSWLFILAGMNDHPLASL